MNGSETRTTNREASSGRRAQLVLCLSDPLATAPFLPGGRTWASRALQDHLIGVLVVTLPGDLRQRLLEAQHRQYR